VIYLEKELEKIIKAERKIKKEMLQAKEKRNLLIADALSLATVEADKINFDTEIKIKELYRRRNIKINQINSEIETVTKNEREKITKKVGQKISTIIEEIYKEEISD